MQNSTGSCSRPSRHPATVLNSNHALRSMWVYASKFRHYCAPCVMLKRRHAWNDEYMTWNITGSGYWTTAAGICSHSDTRASVRSRADVWWWVLPSYQHSNSSQRRSVGLLDILDMCVGKSSYSTADSTGESNLRTSVSAHVNLMRYFCLMCLIQSH